MRNSSQIVGIGLVAVGSILAIAIGGWLVAGLVSSDLEAGGAILGGIFGFIFLVAPLIGVGSFILVRSRSESRQMDQVALQRQLLARIELAGEIGIADLALEVGLTRDEVRANLVDLVSKGLFSGYVDWDRGRLFARQAAELRNMHHCQSCGSELELAGKGLIRCPYCGTEYFLP
ncbi:MAG: hypothetical protein R3A46_11540 [Thermomicrobiales bacterium]